MVFIFDSSASIGEKNWWVTKQFAIDVVKGLVIKYGETRIGAITYSRDATTHWDLGGRCDLWKERGERGRGGRENGEWCRSMRERNLREGRWSCFDLKV